jgi:putative hemolysin
MSAQRPRARQVKMDFTLILILVAFNGLFSLAEMSVVAARQARLLQFEDQRRRGAVAALGLHKDPSRFLSTVQVGITAVGVLSGAVGESLVADPIAARAAEYAVLEPYAQGIGLGVAVALITYLSVVLGELVPKRLALLAPERVALVIALPMNWLSRVARPLVWLLTRSSDAVLALLPGRGDRGPPVTDEEIAVLMEQGAEAGVFHEAEQTMVTNVLRLDERRVTSIMTPRQDFYVIDLDDAEEEVRARIAESPHHRLLVCRGGTDNLIGVAETSELLADLVRGKPLDIAARSRMPLLVPETATTTSLLETFRAEGVHHALVADEYGEVQGLVTRADLLDAIVGEIGLAGVTDEPGISRRDDGSWLVDGGLPVEHLQDALELGPMPGQDTHQFTTVAGFVLHQLGRIPQVADHFRWNDLRFEVVDMDGRRVDKVLASREEPAA